MSIWLSALFALTWALPAFADPVTCRGSLSFPARFIHFNCFNGRCSGHLPGTSLSSFGSCDSAGLSFNATAYDSGGFFSGACTGNSFSSYFSPASLEATGSCSNGSTFRSRVDLPGEFLTASCQPNGNFSIYTRGSSVRISGSCDSG